MRKIAMLLAVLSVLAILSGCTTEVPSATEVKPLEEKPTEAISEMPEATETEAAAVVEEADDMALFEMYLGDDLDSSHYKNNNGIISLLSEYKVYAYDDLPEDGYIVIDGQTKVTTEKTTLNELLQQGWDLGFELTDESEIGANISASGYSLTKDGHEIRIGLMNDTDEKQHLENAKISYVSLEQYDYRLASGETVTPIASAADFSIDGKINQNSNIHNILDAYGEPTSIEFVITNNDSYMTVKYNGLHFYMSMDGNVLYKAEWF